ncbi:MAG TPA: hypothetical protein DCQ26_06775 [Marinilabiliales bacterium]|jgi:hypothetical protein|nr:MAG: hypothetical protein A2W95_11590 [Bacteroidetes bacterium GWA2_40_14]OFX59846.1 MAG: hypothetical protein A2W84_06595 [Bacteroidetes bacterium GWC2_40_13]OFX71582.1 MAG: hypothetical protein A2W96_10580 [Bacteroidetes bacterium GWD2_40_43]OFX95616.1 MAG: hypothetical protein A2W97_00900 [Bacteroidetes bacterium GWE2_40_63]OFY22226.1 MAG: hypothetical protein A2W88_06825 [Bacteroidetes bacterium GWF2_40_13]OFZ24865.1 MAG: hypothetical protein A2437_14460 [Bacteroidetes bacterium RIFOXYC
MNIRHLKYNEIDKLKWDRCISQSFNGIVFAYAWYLDIVSYQWEALVLDDYVAVMPLTFPGSYSLSTLKQPAYANQLGIFTSKLLDYKMVDAFLSLVAEKYRKVEICLNTFNKTQHSSFFVKKEFAYQLDLILPYKSLYLNFDAVTKEKIKYSKINKIQVEKHVNLKDFLLLKKNTDNEPLTFEHLNTLRRIIPFTISHNIGETFGAYDDKNQLVAVAYFIKSHQKAINLLSAVSEEGAKLYADVFIIDKYLKENAERNLTLCFAGPAHKNQAELIQGLGAKPVNYLRIKKKRWFNFLWPHK